MTVVNQRGLKQKADKDRKWQLSPPSQGILNNNVLSFGWICLLEKSEQLIWTSVIQCQDVGGGRHLTIKIRLQTTPVSLLWHQLRELVPGPLLSFSSPRNFSWNMLRIFPKLNDNYRRSQVGKGANVIIMYNCGTVDCWLTAGGFIWGTVEVAFLNWP